MSRANFGRQINYFTMLAIFIRLPCLRIAAGKRLAYSEAALQTAWPGFRAHPAEEYF
jgi:hypothetical protein